MSFHLSFALAVFLVIFSFFSFKQSTAGIPSKHDGICASIIKPYGYNCDEFEVKTKDGYILSMQRILGGLNEESNGTKKQPVLLQHGVIVDGVTWLINSPEKSFAYILADSGYDVWIANSRGTQWSQRHVSLDSSSAAYWDWSWDELAAYELPAMVDFVYNQTGQKLHYVGHSQGSLIALVALSEGRLVNNLKSVALLSPVAFLSGMTTPLGILAAKAFLGEIMSDLLQMHMFNPKGEALSKFLEVVCHFPGINCYDIMNLITGVNCCLNASTVDHFLKYEPQPTSTKNMVHFAQLFRDNVVAKYNYNDEIDNYKRYGQYTPPMYNLSNIPRNIPLFLSYGGRDLLSDVEDVQHLLYSDLKFHDRDKLKVQFIVNYAHADFVMAVSAKETVYNAVISFFKSNTNNS